jgi:lipopolysaccharide/colanic/teichoic acid biosynthesis glycosyltransferase
VAIEPTVPSHRRWAAAATPGVTAASVRRRTDRPGIVIRPQLRARPHVISEPFFKSILVREFRRTERSNLPTVLVLFSCGSTGSTAHREWSALVDAINTAKRETDILGWFTPGLTMGVVLPEVDGAAADAGREFEFRVRRELCARSNVLLAERVSIRVHLGPAFHASSESVVRDPLPLPVRPRSQQAAAYQATKRTLDIIGSAALLLLLAPLLALIAAVVKLTSRGPVFFRQVRIGQMGRPFRMLKFRSMRVDADHAIHEKFVADFIRSGAATSSSTAAPFKIARDPRVTPIGRILRKTSLDELPQLWNVLIGEMSLVGPRPPIPYEVAQYKLWHNRRLFEARPGITGLWQVKGRSRTTFDEMVRLDLRYVKSCSLWTDLKILLATPAAVISGKGAC